MRRLDHANLPRTIDGGVDGSGRPYLAMEFLDGRQLADLIDEHPQLPASWAAALGAQIAAGLAAAHAEGVTHRDLKPANVMLLPGGLVKVLDFGLGRMVDDTGGSRLTSSGVTVGTARYMAPEQFHTSAVTPAADLYALGCVLFELLTGVPPFHSASPLELGQKHCTETPPPLRTLRQDVPRDLELLIDRLLRKEPADRPESAAVVRDALIRAGDGRRPRCPGGRTPTRCGGYARRRRAPGVTSTAPDPRPSGFGMDMFDVHRRLIADYRSFTEAGTVIRDERIADFVRGRPRPQVAVARPVAVAEPVLRLRRRRCRSW